MASIKNCKIKIFLKLSAAASVCCLDFCLAIGHSPRMDLLNLCVYILVPAVVIFLALLLFCLLGYGIYSLFRQVKKRFKQSREEG